MLTEEEKEYIRKGADQVLESVPGCSVEDVIGGFEITFSEDLNEEEIEEGKEIIREHLLRIEN